MATIIENTNRIKSATDEIRKIVDACVGIESTDRVENYPNKLAQAITDTPTEQTFNGTRTLNGIKDGVAYIDKIKGNSYFDYDEGSLLSFNGTSIQSNGRNLFNDKAEHTYTYNIAGTIRYDSIRLNLTAGSYYAKTFRIPEGFKDYYYLYIINKNSSKVENAAVAYFIAEQQKRKGSFTITEDQDVALVNVQQEKLILDGLQIMVCRGTVEPTEFAPFKETVTLPLNISTIHNTDGTQLFPNGLCSAGDVYDEITPTKAIKRVSNEVSSDGSSYLLLDEPIEVDLTGRKHYYNVENNGTETLVAEGNTTPLTADIGYRSAMSAEELVTTLNNTLNS